jgi:phospholipase/carboxylesterase
MTLWNLRWRGVLVIALLVGCKEPAASSSPAPAPPAGRAPTLGLVEFTTGGASDGDTLPLVLALHGLGDRPESFAGLLRGLPAAARVYALRAPLLHGDGFSWFPPSGRAVVDVSALGPGVRGAAELLLADLDALVARKPTRGKPLLTGFSQGGMVSFAVAAMAPGRIAGAFPVGGVLPSAIEPTAPPPGAPRLMAFHGASDARVPTATARDSVERFRARGWQVSLQEYPGVGHSISADERRDLLQAIATSLP